VTDDFEFLIARKIVQAATLPPDGVYFVPGQAPENL
jgi:hypothetical protein